MYIQITTRCNMECAHCCYSCTELGEDMPFGMFKTIVDRWGAKMQRDRNRILFGGGEPTIHPEFWRMMNYAMTIGLPLVVTNGAKAEDAIMLAELAKTGRAWGILSLDKWHKPIEQEVIDAFKTGLVEQPGGHWWKSPKEKRKIDRRSIKVTKFARKQGRNADNPTGKGGCCCPLLLVRPNGIIHGCGCNDAPIVGTVQRGFLSHYKNRIPSFKNPPVYRVCSKDW